jgi:hypothetical protein
VAERTGVPGAPTSSGPAFYARRGGRLADWWTLLHPPYTVWHLGYAAMGAALAPVRDWTAVLATLTAFLLAVGIAAHALDEMNGRPLGTAITDRALRLATVLALGGAVALGLAGVERGAWSLVVLIPVGVILVVAYNLELFGGRLHSDLVFAAAWGGFPVVVGFAGQQPPFTWRLSCALVALTVAATGTAYAQRLLSSPARGLRRRTASVTGTVTSTSGLTSPLTRGVLLAPLERSLLALSWSLPLLAVAWLLSP